MIKARVCELCNDPAALYCASDSAFLCWNCDFRVHGANFLVARHVRQALCTKCDGFRTSESPDHDHNCNDTDSASVSSTESFVTGDDSMPAKSAGKKTSSMTTKKKREKPETRNLSRSRTPATKVDVKIEDILVNWSRKMGQNSSLIVRVALQALGFRSTKLTGVPFRVLLASSFWLSMRICRKIAEATCQNLKRLEEISGVPAKLIVAGERKLALALRDRKIRLDQEEEWAESL